MVFRFDDVCINADLNHINSITDLILEKYPDAKIVYAISPMVHEDCGERIFPKIMNALSDFRKFYMPDKIGIPELRTDIIRATHGLIHVDHRLLSREAQEMSIMISASITKSVVFVPPFNKWNKDTEEICEENKIELIKFENGWRCMEYEPLNKYIDMWYLHAREMTIEQVKKWLNGN